MLIGAEITERILAAAIEVHKRLGPGLMESAYQACLSREMALRGIEHECEVDLPVDYKGVQLDCGYRLDMVVENAVIVELKSVQAVLPIHEAQLLTYLKLSGKRVGLILNFNVPILMDGQVRRVL